MHSTGQENTLPTKRASAQLIATAAKLFFIIPFRNRVNLSVACVANKVPTNDEWGMDSKHFGKLDNPSIWSEQKLNLDRVLHQSVAHLLGFKSGEDHIFWQLVPEAIRAINRRFDPKLMSGETILPMGTNWPSDCGLAVSLTKAACKRLSRSDAERMVPIKLVACDLYLPQSELGELVVELELADEMLDVSTMIEVAHHLAHRRYGKSESPLLHRMTGKSEVIVDNTRGAPWRPFKIVDLMTSLAWPANEPSPLVDVPTSFSYMLVKFDDVLPEPDRRELAMRLARRLTSDYAPTMASESVGFASTFDNVTTACAFEGGATLVTGGKKIPFLRDFDKTVGKPIYLRLAALAYKELHELTAMSEAGAFTIAGESEADAHLVGQKKRNLLKLHEKVLNFRLVHRFSLAGFGTNHNMVHSAWRKIFHLDQMLDQIAGDIKEATIYLGSVHANHIDNARTAKEKALSKRTAILTGAVTFFGIIEGSHALMKLGEGTGIFPSHESAKLEQLAGLFGKHLTPEQTSVWEKIVFGGIIMVAVAAALFAWNYARKGSRAGGHH